MQTVKVFNPTGIKLPKQSTPNSAAKDIRANIMMVNPKFGFGAAIGFVDSTVNTGILPDDVMVYSDPTQDTDLTAALIIKPNGRVLIPSGLKIQLPEGFHMDIRPRSGLALKYGIELVNSPGLIDEDYRGDVGIILKNGGFDTIIVVDEERIGQIMIAPDTNFDWEEIDSEEELTETVRGEGGFNSTGTK